MASSLVGGAVAGLFAIKAFALVGPGLASITMFVDEANPMNLVWALVTLGILCCFFCPCPFLIQRQSGRK